MMEICKKNKNKKTGEKTKKKIPVFVCFFKFFFFFFLLKDPVGNSQDGTREQRSYSPKENDIEKPYSQVEESLLQKLNLKCSQREPTSCAMLKLITYMNRLFKKANIDITENIEITQTSAVAEVKGNYDNNNNKIFILLTLNNFFFFFLDYFQPKIYQGPFHKNQKKLKRQNY